MATAHAQVKAPISLMMPLIASYKSMENIERESTVAKRLGVEPTALVNYKNGERRVPDHALALLADRLEMPMGDVIAAANIGLMRTDADEEEFWMQRIQDERMKKLANDFRKWRRL